MAEVFLEEAKQSKYRQVQNLTEGNHSSQVSTVEVDRDGTPTSDKPNNSKPGEIPLSALINGVNPEE
jgi:hypothetical protein